MKYIKYVIALVASLIGLVFWERGKRKSAESLNENLATKEEVQKLEGQRLENAADLKVEEERRKDAEKQASDEKSKPVVDSDVIDFFKKLK